MQDGHRIPVIQGDQDICSDVPTQAAEHAGDEPDGTPDPAIGVCRILPGQHLRGAHTVCVQRMSWTACSRSPSAASRWRSVVGCLNLRVVISEGCY